MATSASRPCILSGGMEVVRRAITVVIAQAALAAMPTRMAFQSSMAWGSSVIQATPAKAIPMPIRAGRDSRSRKSRKANRAVNGTHSCAATETGLTSRASQKAR